MEATGSDLFKLAPEGSKFALPPYQHPFRIRYFLYHDSSSYIIISSPTEQRTPFSGRVSTQFPAPSSVSHCVPLAQSWGCGAITTDYPFTFAFRKEYPILVAKTRCLDLSLTGRFYTQ